MSGFLSGWGVRLAIVAVIIVGGFILRDRLSSSAGDLKVGDCFDEPASGGEISDVQHHPCTESHTAEVVFLGEMTGENSTYPTDDQFDQYAATNCLPAFTSYTGRAVETETELTMSYYVPTQGRLGQGQPPGDLLRAPGRQPADDAVGQGRGAVEAGEGVEAATSAAIATGVSCSRSSRPNRAARSPVPAPSRSSQRSSSCSPSW